MGLFGSVRNTVDRVTSRLFDSNQGPTTIGIYGPANAGKSTITQRIIDDWTDDDTDDIQTSEVPHETRETHRHDEVTIEHEDGASVTIDVIDTPGIETKVDSDEFMSFDEFDDDDAKQRAREATEGIAEAMHWLREDMEGVIYMLDSTEDPFTQVNTTILGLIESRDMPVIILANKTDLDDANVARIQNAFPQHEVIPVSALHGENMEAAYEAITDHFA